MREPHLNPFEHLAAPVLAIDLDGRIRSANQRLRARLGGSATEDLVGSPVSALSSHPSWEEVVRRIDETGEAFLTLRVGADTVELVVTRSDSGYVAAGSPDGLSQSQQRIAEAVDALRLSEQRYRSLVQATAAIVWTTPASGDLPAQQAEWRAFTGQSAEEMAGSGWLDAIHPDDREKTVAAWERALAERGMYEVEHRVRRHDGEYRHMSARGVPIVDDRGEVREWVGLHTDVTAQRTLQKMLEVERLRLREVFTRAPALIATLRGPEHIFEVTNPRYLQLIGNREVIGKPVREALPEVAGQGYFELLDRVYETGEPFEGRDMRVLLTGPDGGIDERYVDFVYQPLRDANGAVTGIFVHGNDVTTQVRARQQVEAQAAQLEEALRDLQYQSSLNRIITDNAASCLFMMDERGHPTFMNPAAEQVTGYTLEEIRHEPLHHAVHHHHPDGRPYPISECPIDNGREQLVALKDYRDIFVRKDGSFFPVSCYVAPLERDGTTVGAVLEFRDITDELRAQEALREADRRKDEFLATLSHELRTPLTAILGWSRLLRMGNNDEETIATAVATIEKSAQAQAELIEDVLDLSRIVSGKIRIDTGVVDVPAVASAAIEGVQLAAAAKEIELTSELPEGDPPLILGDANRLQQIIWNLLTNAIKFTPAGGAVRVTVASDDEFVRIAVADTGIGVAPEFLPHVFEPFRQQESATTRVHGGLGLGLSIVRHLVELHGGSIRADSDGDAKGATFTVEIPRLKRVPDLATLPEVAPVEVLAETGRHLADLTGVSVLVIDDQPAVREFLAAVLRKAGAEVQSAGSVEEAFRALPERLPSVILCDIAMPHEDGFAFLQRLRAVPWSRRVPVVAVTAFSRPEDRDRILAAGFDEYVRKPVEPSTLTRVVANYGLSSTAPA